MPSDANSDAKYNYGKSNPTNLQQRSSSTSSSLWKTTKKWVQLKKLKSDKNFSNGFDTINGNLDHQSAASGLKSPTDCNIETQQLRLFVGTWNVAGRAPTNEWVMYEWLVGSDSNGELHEGGEFQESNVADIYAIGFQEIVPLNAGNVLVVEDKTSARKWDNLIREALVEVSRNSSGHGEHKQSNPTIAKCTRDKASTTSQFRTNNDDDDENDNDNSNDNDTDDENANINVKMMQEFKNDGNDLSHHMRRHSSVELDRLRRFMSRETELNHALSGRISSASDCIANPRIVKPSRLNHDRMKSVKARDLAGNYVRVVSKQMVGLFITVWMRQNLLPHVKSVEVSTVGCGIMGCLGNKGSISVSISMCETNLCFVCCHLNSGDRPTDVARRNADVAEILRRTRFRRSLERRNFPDNILAHDRIIWFGDLNYRISLPSEELKSLVANEDWKALLKNDQLKYECGFGRVFEGWHEGHIYFAPTYKYTTNSDLYSMVDTKEGTKSRAPAWCDRILWYGKGLRQLSYTRSESRHSDHRPVGAMFMLEVEMLRAINPPVFQELIISRSPANGLDSMQILQSSLEPAKGSSSIVNDTQLIIDIPYVLSNFK